jgi:hypothetical protein
MMTGMPSRHRPANSIRGVSALPAYVCHGPRRVEAGNSDAPWAKRPTSVDNRSLTGDVMIMWRTVESLMKPKGAS